MRRRLRARFARYVGDERGAAALEFALWLVFLVPVIANIVDVSFYAYDRMMVREAAQTAAQTAWATCSSAAKGGTTYVPAGANCPGLALAMQQAVGTTTLGSRVALQTGSEAFYCVNTSGVLTDVSTTDGTVPTSGTGTAPNPNSTAACSSYGANFAGSTATSGDWVLIKVTYTFKPFFGKASITSLLPTTINETAWMRLN